LNVLACGFRSTPALFASPVLDRRGREARVCRALLAHRAIGPFAMRAVKWPPFAVSGALRIATFPTMGILLAIAFQTAEMET
jgi:hypothetical protein